MQKQLRSNGNLLVRAVQRMSWTMTAVPSIALLWAWAFLTSCNNTHSERHKERAASVDDTVLDEAVLQRSGHPAAYDVNAVIDGQMENLARCADSVRQIVRERRNEIGFGKVRVTVELRAKQGNHVTLKTVDVEPVFALQPTFESCIRSVLDGESTVTATSDYVRRVRFNLCIRPERQKIAVGKGIH